MLGDDLDVYHRLQAHFTSLGRPVDYHLIEERPGWEDLGMLGHAVMMHAASNYFKELLERK